MVLIHPKLKYEVDNIVKKTVPSDKYTTLADNLIEQLTDVNDEELSQFSKDCLAVYNCYPDGDVGELLDYATIVKDAIMSLGFLDFRFTELFNTNVLPLVLNAEENIDYINYQLIFGYTLLLLHSPGHAYDYYTHWSAVYKKKYDKICDKLTNIIDDADFNLSIEELLSMINSSKEFSDILMDIIKNKEDVTFVVNDEVDDNDEVDEVDEVDDNDEVDEVDEVDEDIVSKIVDKVIDKIDDETIYAFKG